MSEWNFAKETTQEDEIDLFMGIISEYIESDEDRKKIKAVYKEHWPRISTMQASKSGKYHHWTEQTVHFGLLNHVIRGLYFARELGIEEAGYESKKPEFQPKQQMRLVAMVVHDMGKMNASGNNHGVYIHPILKPHGFDSKVRMMAQNHMHKWSPYKAENKSQRIVAYADYLASRADIDVRGITYMMKVKGVLTAITHLSQCQIPWVSNTPWRQITMDLTKPIADVDVNIQGA